MRAFVALTACCLTSMTVAAADDTQAQCLSAYADGQRARNAGEFERASKLFAFCGGMSCPSAMHGDCQRWLQEVEERTPTAVFRVVGEAGEELTEASVTIDADRKHALTGRALAFDPGEHELTFSAPGYQPAKSRIRFVEGEKLVAHEIRLSNENAALATAPPADGAPAASASPSSTLWPTWLGLGVGALGAAGFTYFGLDARAKDRALDSCSPNCSASRVEHVEQRYRWANVSLGVGIAGLVGAATWLLLRPRSAPPSGTDLGAGVSWYCNPGVCGFEGSF